MSPHGINWVERSANALDSFLNNPFFLVFKTSARGKLLKVKVVRPLRWIFWDQIGQTTNIYPCHKITYILTDQTKLLPVFTHFHLFWPEVLGDEQARTPIFYPESFDMDSVQVGKQYLWNKVEFPWVSSPGPSWSTFNLYTPVGLTNQMFAFNSSGISTLFSIFPCMFSHINYTLCIIGWEKK